MPFGAALALPSLQRRQRLFIYILCVQAKRFLSALAKHDVSSLKELRKVWTSDKSFLLEEYLEWVQWPKQARLRSVWPPL